VDKALKDHLRQIVTDVVDWKRITPEERTTE